MFLSVLPIESRLLQLVSDLKKDNFDSFEQLESDFIKYAKLGLVFITGDMNFEQQISMTSFCMINS